MQRRYRADLAFLVVATAIGCGGETGAGGTRDAGGDGGGQTRCPQTPPVNGGACQPPFTDSGQAFPALAAHCAWGDDPRPECRTAGLCVQGSWQITAPSAGCSTPPLPAACPSAPPGSGTCTDSTLACWYPDGNRCLCSACRGGSEYPLCQPIDPPEWACFPVQTGCPSKIPSAGASCSTEGASCGPDCNLQVVCEGGVWKWRRGMCPICAAPGTPVATPGGERPIAELRAGDLVYSLQDGAVVAVPVVLTGNTPVVDHWVVRVTLDTGRTLEVSPGHPLADGSHFSDLGPGMSLGEGVQVTAVELVPYRHDRTYDILPASSTGTYLAAGAWIGSTLRSQVMSE